MGKKLSEWVIQRSQTGEGPWFAELSPVPRPEFALIGICAGDIACFSTVQRPSIGWDAIRFLLQIH